MPSLAGLLAIVVITAGWGVLLAFLGVTAVYGAFEEVTGRLNPDVSTIDLTLPDLSRVSRVYASDGELLAELHDGRVSEPLPIAQIPEVVIYAVLAAEDDDFYEHEGVDFTAIARTAVYNFLYQTNLGGSTITQQVGEKPFCRRRGNHRAQDPGSLRLHRPGTDLRKGPDTGVLSQLGLLRVGRLRS